MKKLAVFLISLMLSFNSYGKWTEIPIIEDGSIEQGFIDFDNLKRKNDDYVSILRLVFQTVEIGIFKFLRSCIERTLRKNCE